jgi:hypothetical protein
MASAEIRTPKPISLNVTTPGADGPAFGSDDEDRAVDLPEHLVRFLGLGAAV